MKIDDASFLAYRKRVKSRDHLMAVRGIEVYRDEVDDLIDNPSEHQGTVLPWPNTSDKIRLRPGELSLWAGKNSHGKSTVLAHVLTWMAAMGETVVVASFEMPVKMTLRKMMQQATGTHQPTPKVRDQFYNHFKGKLYFYDYMGNVDKDLVLDLCDFSAEVLGARHVQIDSLSKVKGMLGDNNEVQAEFVNDLHAAANYFQTHIHLVAHERKGGPESEKRISSRSEVKGSGAIPDQADNVWIVWRDKEKAQSQDDDDSPDFVIHVDKQRHGNWEGYISLWAPHVNCNQFVPSSNRRTMRCPRMPI